MSQTKSQRDLILIDWRRLPSSRLKIKMTPSLVTTAYQSDPWVKLSASLPSGKVMLAGSGTGSTLVEITFGTRMTISTTMVKSPNIIEAVRTVTKILRNRVRRNYREYHSCLILCCVL